MERKYGSAAAGKLKHKIIKVEKLCRQLTDGVNHNSNPKINHLYSFNTANVLLAGSKLLNWICK